MNKLAQDTVIAAGLWVLLLAAMQTNWFWNALDYRVAGKAFQSHFEGRE